MAPLWFAYLLIALDVPWQRKVRTEEINTEVTPAANDDPKVVSTTGWANAFPIYEGSGANYSDRKTRTLSPAAKASAANMKLLHHRVGVRLFR
jgi:hypothetical protein